MGKNIVLLLDGTGNKFGDTNSNVAKLATMLDRKATDQVSFYLPGLGTMGEVDQILAFEWITRGVRYVAENAFGYGIFRNIKESYSFLMRTYEHGDKVFIFGFSRGAYTARALCGMLHMFGLIDRGNEYLIDYVFAIFKNPKKDKNWEISKKFKNAFARTCKPHFVGVWDTVSSVGGAYNPLELPFTFKNSDIATGRHAVALNERRAFFPVSLWDTSNEQQDLQEVWFKGVHSDVGGGYPESESGLSKIPLQWILDDAEKAGLRIDQTRKTRVMGGSAPYVPPNPNAKAHKSLVGFWWLVEFIPKHVWSPSKKRHVWRINRFRGRDIPKDAVKWKY